MLELDHIYNMDCRVGLATMPAESVDCIVTSPPYWGLRDYGLEPLVWDGKEGCEHVWGDNILSAPTIQYTGKHTKRLNKGWADSNKNREIKSTSQGAFCSLCGAWRGSLGLEPTFQLYLNHLMQVMAECKRVLKRTGTMWVNLGDSYSNEGKWGGKSGNKNSTSNAANMPRYKKDYGVQQKSLCQIPERFSIAMTDELGLIKRNTIIWYKRNCLNGGTRLYAKTQKGTMPSSLKDLVRLAPDTVQLWDGEKWNQVVEWVENTAPTDIRLITIRSGETITCTADHRFPTARGVLAAKDLVVGDVIQSAQLPDNNNAEPERLPADVGWFVGLYLAEGSMSGKCIQIAGHANERDRYDKLSELAHYYHGTCTFHHNTGDSATINLYSDVLRGVLDEYLTGRTSHDKHLSSKAWSRSNEFLFSLLQGYLDGDGHWDETNRRWRLAFTRNTQLARDLRCIVARLGYKIRIVNGVATCNGKTFPVYRGELRMQHNAHHNTKSPYEIVALGKGKNCGRFWDVVLADEPHLFSTIGGMLIHNCMPSSAKDRFTVDFEPVYFFVKQGKYWFEQQKEPIANSTERRVALANSRKDEADIQSTSVRAYKRCDTAAVSVDKYKDGRDHLVCAPSSDGRNRRCVWDIPTRPFPESHFAVFPPDLVEPMILSGCPPDGIVLDPFIGSGTVAAVSQKCIRHYIGFELQPDYIPMTEKRTQFHREQTRLAL